MGGLSPSQIFLFLSLVILAMIMDSLLIVDGFAIFGIFIAWLIIRKELLVFSGVVILLAGIGVMADGSLQYASSYQVPTNSTTITFEQQITDNSLNITNITGNSTTTQLQEIIPVYSSIYIWGQDIYLLIALSHLAFGALICFKAMWE